MALGKWQSRALRFGGSAILLFAIFWFIPISRVIAALSEAHLGYAVASLAVMLSTAYIDALALWLPMNRIGVPGSQWVVFEIKMITRFYAQFLPSELMASAVKLHRLAGPTKQWGEVTAALVFARVVSTLVLVLLGFTLWAIEMPQGPGRLVGYVLAAMGAGLLIVHLTVQSAAATKFVKRVFMMIGLSKLEGKLFNKVIGLAQTTVNSYRLFGNTVYPVILLALARHLLGIGSFLLVAMALDIQLSFLTVGWIRVVMHALLMLPISIAGIGVREGSLVILLQEYSVSPDQAVALAFLLFIVTMLSNCTGGLFEIKNLLSKRPASDPVQDSNR